MVQVNLVEHKYRQAADLLQPIAHSHNVSIDVTPINDNMQGSYQTDDVFKANFQHYVNELWVNKDQQLADIYAQQDLPEPKMSKEHTPIAVAVIELRKFASGTFSNQGAINSCRWVLVIVFQFPY